MPSCPTNLLQDKPAREDEFSSNNTDGIGPHSRIATAISHLIDSEHTHKSTVVGIEGEWGSGKSTVVELLKSSLSSSEKIHVIIFDAWAHEGDPLRRTFLETIINHFRSKGYLSNKDSWDDELEKLARKRVITDTNTSTSITLLGKIFGFSLFLIPIGLKLMPEPFKYRWGINLTDPLWYQSVFAVILSFAFIAVLAINAVRLLKKGNGALKSSQNWKFLAGESNIKVTTDSRSNPEPTSLEFEDLFQKVMNQVLDKDNDQRVVIVLDNLDRIDSKDAKSIWSTLQTFIKDTSFKNPWSPRLWFIVPYDPRGLSEENISKQVEREEIKTDPSKDPPSNPTTKRSIPQSSSADTPKLRSLYDKSFSIIFEVPPLVLSNWKSYFIRLFNEALPTHGNDADKVFRVYNHYCRLKSLHPTPREIKIFLNQIGSIHRQWHDHFPLDHVAYYTVLRRERLSIQMIFSEENLPYIDTVLREDLNLRENLCGLAFNVTADLGIQLILTNSIFSALLQENTDEFIKLSELYREGFWAVLEQSYQLNVGQFTSQETSQAIINLSDKRLDNKKNRVEFLHLLEFLYKHLGRSLSYWPLNKVTVTALSLLAQRNSSQETFSRIESSIQNGIAQNLRNSDNPSDIIESVTAIELLESLLQSSGGYSILDKKFTVTNDITVWSGFCGKLLENKVSDTVIRTLQVGFNPSALVSHIKEDISRGLPRKETTSELKTCLLCYPELDYSEVIDAAKTEFNVPSIIVHQAAVNILDMLKMLSEHGIKDSEDALRMMIEDGSIAESLSDDEGMDIDYSATVLALYAKYNPNLDSSSANSIWLNGYSTLISLLTTENQQLSSALLQILENELNTASISNFIENLNFTPFLTQLICESIDRGANEDLFSLKFVKDHWETLKERVSPTPGRFNRLIYMLIEQRDIDKKIISEGITFEEKDSGFYLDLIYSSSTPISNLRDWCLNKLDNISKAQWVTNLRENNRTVDLLIKISGDGTRLNSGINLQDAIVEISDQIISDSFDAEEIGWNFESVAAVLNESNQIVLKSRLLESMTNANGIVSSLFIRLFGEAIIDKRTLLSNPRPIGNVFWPILTERDPDSIQWLSRAASSNPLILDQSGDAEVAEEFKLRVANMMANPQDNEAIIDSLRVIEEQWKCRTA